MESEPIPCEVGANAGPVRFERLVRHGDASAALFHFVDKCSRRARFAPGYSLDAASSATGAIER
jgi:hypothetical protein